MNIVLYVEIPEAKKNRQLFKFFFYGDFLSNPVHIDKARHWDNFRCWVFYASGYVGMFTNIFILLKTSLSVTRVRFNMQETMFFLIWKESFITFQGGG